MPTGRIVRSMVGRALGDFYPPRADLPPGDPPLTVGGGNAELANIDLICARARSWA